MTPPRAVAALAAFAAVTACSEQDFAARDTGDVGYTGPWAIESVARECDPGTPDTWAFAVRTKGWAHAVDLHVIEPGTPPTTETHPLANVDYDRAGTWDEWAATLLTASESADAQSGATTAWGCADAGDLGWQVVMFAADAPQTPIDCVAWGDRASAAMAGPQGLVCRCVEEDGDCAP